jgi:hypothetical protein
MNKKQRTVRNAAAAAPIGPLLFRQAFGTASVVRFLPFCFDA